MSAAVHVKLISVTIYPFIFSESERNARQELHVFASVYLSSAQSHGTIYGAILPKVLGVSNKVSHPTVSFLFPPSLFISVFLAFSTRTAHTSLHAHTHTHTHTHTLNHTVDTGIQTYAFFHLPKQTEHLYIYTVVYSH